MFARTSLRAIILITALVGTGQATANENVAGRPTPGPALAQQGEEKSRFPIIENPRDLPPTLKKALGVKDDGTPEPAAAGDAGPPFTTSEASAVGEIAPVDKAPWRATGKILMTFADGSYVCSGSVIGQGLVVTAAHCVHNFGKQAAGFAHSISFEPARYADKRPYGTWRAKEWWISKAYYDGTDKCTVAGIVCENDVAVIVLEKLNDKFVAEVVGKYSFKTDDWGYFDLFGKKATQITQLGYPQKNYDGARMLRTDSLGYQDSPSNVIIGSAQTGGSSGCPWIMNFGTPSSSYVGPAPNAGDPNQVVATTSWGYNTGKVMVQGASRFARNSIYTTKSNIQSLVDSACGANSGFCN
jgi:V8-like Glu-specific endopeptidase